MATFKCFKCIAAGLLILPLFAPHRAASAQEAPAFEWRKVAPEEQGMSTAKLDALRDDLAGAKHRPSSSSAMTGSFMSGTRRVDPRPTNTARRRWPRRW